MRHPDRRFARAILLRSFAIWLVVRCAVEFVGRAAARLGGMPPDRGLSVFEAAVLAAFTTVILLFDLRRTGEELFLAELGVSTVALAVVGAIPALAGELVLDGLIW
jgi:hypothetical protein